MMSFDLLSVVNSLTSNGPEKYRHERVISLFQFQTWIYFPEDHHMVDAAGKLAAAAFLRKHEREIGKNIPGMGGGRDINANVLIKLLRTTDYGRLYDAYFEDGGWTGLLRTLAPEQFNRNITERRKATETVCEMIDFRFRALDHKTLDTKQSNISRSEFYRWHEHPAGKLAWRTIRSRWKDNRSSAPFLYVNERLFGGSFCPPLFDVAQPTKALIGGAPNRQQVRKFIGTSLYVAKTVESDFLKEYDGMETLALPPIRAKTSALSKPDLEKMDFYKEKRDEMRSN
jgi:hypothetical protein